MQQIKKRKGVGLRAARKDKDGKDLVRAEDAENGRTYYCPFCGTDMHVTHPHNGVPIFLHIPGKQHNRSKGTACCSASNGIKPVNSYCA